MPNSPETEGIEAARHLETHQNTVPRSFRSGLKITQFFIEICRNNAGLKFGPKIGLSRGELNIISGKILDRLMVIEERLEELPPQNTVTMQLVKGTDPLWWSIEIRYADNTIIITPENGLAKKNGEFIISERLEIALGVELEIELQSILETVDIAKEVNLGTEEFVDLPTARSKDGTRPKMEFPKPSNARPEIMAATIADIHREARRAAAEFADLPTSTLTTPAPTSGTTTTLT